MVTCQFRLPEGVLNFMKSNYFPHDFNARNDEKILKLYQHERLEGIGAFWLIIEMLYEAGGWLKLNYEDLCFSMRLGKNKISLLKKVVENYELFEKKENQFTNSRVLRTLNYIKEKSKKAKKSAKIRWDKDADKNPTVMPTQCDGIATRLDKTRLDETRLDETRLDETKKKEYISKIKYLDFVFLTKGEYNKLVRKYGEDNAGDLIHRLNNYIGSKGKDKYASHYYTLLSWARHNELEILEDITEPAPPQPQPSSPLLKQITEMKRKSAEADKKIQDEFYKLPPAEQEKRKKENTEKLAEILKTAFKQ